MRPNDTCPQYLGGNPIHHLILLTGRSVQDHVIMHWKNPGTIGGSTTGPCLIYPNCRTDLASSADDTSKCLTSLTIIL